MVARYRGAETRSMTSLSFRSSALTVLALVTVSCTVPQDRPNAGIGASGGGTDYFADNGLGNAVAVVQHPAGEYRDGITYVAYQGPMEDPYVAAYNHETGEWSGSYPAGESELGRRPLSEGRIDNHGKPTMIIDQAGYIHIFYGGHGGSPDDGPNPLGNIHNGANKHAVSARPLDITEWVDLDNIPPFGTYNQAVMMDNGDIYLFYRHGAHRSDWVYQKSTDNGRTFEDPVSFLKHGRRDDLQAEDSWYAYATRGKGDEIIVSFDYHICWDNDGAPDERGHRPERHDVYYMVFDTSDGSWRNVQGEQLPMPLNRVQADQYALVARTNGLWTFNGSATLDPQGNPHIGITMGSDIGQKAGGPKQMRHYRWTGSEWVGGHSTSLPIANGDLIAHSDQHIRLLLESNDASGDGIVAWWESTDGGRSFARQREILRRPAADFAISSFIRNAHPDARLLVAEIPRGTHNRRMYLLGDGGPLERVWPTRE